MKSKIAVALVGLLVVAATALAGDEKSKCSYSTQECLDIMAMNMKASGWVGVELERKEEGYGAMTVIKVVPDSPAQGSGIKAGDVLVAMNGITLSEENQEKLRTARAEWKPGTSVTWTMLRGEEKRELSIQLAPMPADLLARYIGQHMLDHASTEVAAN